MTTRPQPEVNQFMSIDGYEVVQTLYPCGCFSETSYTTDGEIDLIRVQVCGTCFDELHTKLDQHTLDKRSQLTLDLPSQGDRRTA